MFVKKDVVKKKNGRQYNYYRLVESYREGGKVKHRVKLNLGRLTQEELKYFAFRFAEFAHLEISDDAEELEVIDKKYFGPPLVVEHLIKTLKLDEYVRDATRHRRVDFDLLGVLKVMLCAHLFKGGSRAELAVWDWQQKLFWHPHMIQDFEYQHLLRGLSVLAQAKEAVEKRLYNQLRTLFDINVDLVFYDLTSSYVEGCADWSELLKRGYSRDHRPDCKQVVIGLVVSQEGFPLTFRVFEGNRVDNSTLREMVTDLEDRFRVERCIWVSDTGLFSRESVLALEESGYEYILGMGGSEHKRSVKEAIGDARKLENHEFKGCTVWEMELCEDCRDEVVRLPRVIVIDSPGRKKKTASIFERRLELVRKKFRSLTETVRQRQMRAEEIRIEAEKILHGSRVKKYFDYEVMDGKFSWRENTAAIKERKENAGKYALYTNTDLPLTEVVEAYRTLLAVEDAFLVLKDVLDLRPFWHKCDENIVGHVLLAVWSYLLYKTMETILEKKEIDITPERALDAIKELVAVEIALEERSFWKLIRPNKEIREIIRALGINNLNSMFNQWAKNAPPGQYRPRVMKKSDRRQGS